MKFMVGEKVRVVASRNTGEVYQVEDKTIYKIDIETNKEVKIHTLRYLIKVKNEHGYSSNQWFEEGLLEQDIELVDEESVNKVLIDIALNNRDYEMVKRLTKQ